MLSKLSRSLSPKMLVSLQTPPKLQTQKLDMSVCMPSALNLHLIKRRQHPPTHSSSFPTFPSLKCTPPFSQPSFCCAQGVVLWLGPSAQPWPPPQSRVILCTSCPFPGVSSAQFAQVQPVLIVPATLSVPGAHCQEFSCGLRNQMPVAGGPSWGWGGSCAPSISVPACYQHHPVQETARRRTALEKPSPPFQSLSLEGRGDEGMSPLSSPSLLRTARSPSLLPWLRDRGGSRRVLRTPGFFSAVTLGENLH